MNEKSIVDEILEKIPAPIYFQDNERELCEVDYYGASHLIAEQLELKNLPFSNVGWRHGWMYVPLKYLPQLTVWGKSDINYLTAKEEHAAFLMQHGIKATAVGMPFIYANAIDDSLRRRNSLLVMPQHTLSSVPNVGNEEQYIQKIEKIRNDFDVVVFCIHHSCYEHGVWPALLKKYNYPAIVGASASQINAIKRLQKMFSIFEFVTTNTVGSHLPYAAYCGSKVSIYGQFSDFSNYNFSNDPYAKANPEVINFNIKYTSEPYVRAIVPFMFCEHPNEAPQSVAWAKDELGVVNKKSPEVIAELLGWNDCDLQRRQAYANLQRKINMQEEITLRSILSMLELAQKYRERFAIYGAGHIGEMILRALSIANLKPVCIFDKRHEQISELHGVVVKSPDEISISGVNLDLIIIASFSHKNEIKEHIESINDSVLVCLLNQNG